MTRDRPDHAAASATLHLPEPRLPAAAPTLCHVVSDLHVAAGALQDFPFDDQLIAFLRWSAEQGAMVVMNGDIFDFPQTLPEIEDLGGDPRLGATASQSRERMVEIMHEHRPLFRAMRAFVAGGGVLVMQPGNHDIDLMWPSVRRLLHEAIDPDDSGRFLCRDTTPLVLWGRAWIEHGNQWSIDGNAFERWWAPFVVDPQGALRLEQCWGTWFLRHCINAIDAEIPFVDNVWPFMKMFDLVRQEAPLRLLRYVLSLHRVIVSAVERSPAAVFVDDPDFADAASRERFREEYTALRDHHHDQVRARLRGVRAPGGWRDLVRSPRSAAGRWLKEAGALTILEEIDRRVSNHENELSRFMYAPLVLGWKAELADDPVADVRLAAERIARRFDGIRAVVFGHTHIARDEPMDAEVDARYVNTGTWIPFFNFDEAERMPTFDELRRARRFPYRLTYARLAPTASGDLDASLEVWGGEGLDGAVASRGASAAAAVGA